MSDHPSRIHHASRLVIKGVYGEPSTPAVAMTALTDKAWKQAEAGRHVRNLVRYDLRPVDPDDLDEEGNEKTPRAISLGYKPHFADQFNRLEDWESKVSKEETDLREGRVKELKDRRTELEDKIDAAKDNATQLKDLQDQLADVEAEISQMDKYGPGFLQSVPSGFGDKTATLYDPLNEPYIPRHRVSRFWLEADSPWQARLLWKKPNEDQQDWEGVLQWGYYRLVFDLDRVQFQRLNDKLTPEEIVAKEAQLNQLLDLGRITRADKLQKLEWKRQIDAIKKTASDAGRKTTEKLTDTERTQIKALEKKIDDLWESKRRRTGAQDKQIDDLKKEIYLDTQTVQFGQQVESFFDTPLLLTFLPQTRGYLTIKLEGAQAWTFEEKELLDPKKRKFLQRDWALWPRTKIELKVNGGAHKWQVGAFAPDKTGEVRLPFDTTFNIEGKQVLFDGYWDEVGGANVLFTVEQVETDTTGLKWELIATMTPSPVPDAFDEDDPTVRLLSSQRIPFLYTLNLFIAAGERTGDDVVVWDSKDHPTGSGNSPIIDAKPMWDDRGAVSCNLSLLNTLLPDGTTVLGEFPDVDGHIADLYIDDVDDGDVPYLAGGILKQVSATEMAHLDSESEVPQQRPGSEISLILNDRYAVLDTPMRVQPVGDNKPLGEHIGTCLACRGERDSEMHGIIVDEEMVLPSAGLGREPLSRPARDAQYSSYIGNLLEERGMLLHGDQAGEILQLRWKSGADLLGNIGGYWWLGVPSTVVKQIDGTPVALSSADDGDNRYRLVGTIEIPDDDSQVFNVFTVEGDIDPVTKKRIRVVWPVWESIRKTNDFRSIGREQPYKTVRDDALKSEDEATIYARALSILKCKGKKFCKIKTSFIKQFEKDDIVLADGKQVQLVKPLNASMSSDEMEFLARRLD